MLTPRSGEKSGSVRDLNAQGAIILPANLTHRMPKSARANTTELSRTCGIYSRNNDIILVSVIRIRLTPSTLFERFRFPQASQPLYSHIRLSW